MNCLCYGDSDVSLFTTPTGFITPLYYGDVLFAVLAYI